ncbi:MAG: putative bifunctional diguanylate cyclase/phosphodiesterase [Actinomycetes bacterium]
MPTPTSSTTATQRFTAAWVVALLAIGALATGSWLLVGTTLDTQVRTAALADLLVQQEERAVELGDLLARTASTAMPTDLRPDVASSLDALRADRSRLERTILEDEAGRSATEVIDATARTYGELTTGVEQLVRDWPVDGEPLSDAVLSSRASGLAEDASTYRAALAETRRAAAASARERALETASVQRSMLVATLALLLIEALLVFRPATRRIRATLAQREEEAVIERERSRLQLEHLARFDHLTGLANRTMFRDRLDHAVASAGRSEEHVALMFVDLDRFKDVNDQLGHDAGDRLLVEIGRRLQDVARRTDTVARIGGDEFTVLLEHLDSPDGAATAAQKILDALSVPVDLGGRQVVVSGSIGIAMYPDDARTVDELLRHADTAMYEAKASGKNTFQFSTPELRERNLTRLRTISELRRAVDTEGLRLRFQPQVSLETDEVVAVEALVRWMRQDGSEVQAADWIGLAEDTDMMGPMGEWVLAEACRQGAAWQREGLSLRVAVNLSERQFRQADIAAQVGSALEASGLPAELLELEITEHTLVQDIEAAHVTLRLLKGMGVRIVIDDFGTGYSSISYLKRFPIDALKIDGEFVRDVGSGTDDAMVSAAITGLARHLGLETVAEGVETEAQLAQLRRLGCDRAQGYLVSRALEADDVPGVVRRRRIAPVTPLRSSGDAG